MGTAVSVSKPENSSSEDREKDRSSRAPSPWFSQKQAPQRDNSFTSSRSWKQVPQARVSTTFSGGKSSKHWHGTQTFSPLGPGKGDTNACPVRSKHPAPLSQIPQHPQALSHLPPTTSAHPPACPQGSDAEGSPLAPHATAGTLRKQSRERERRVGGWCSGWWQKAPHVWTPLFISLHSSTPSTLPLEYSRSRVISYLIYIPTWQTLPMTVPCASPLPTDYPPSLTDSGDKSDFLICRGNLEKYANHCKFLFTDRLGCTNR